MASDRTSLRARLLAVAAWAAVSSLLVGCFSCPISQTGSGGGVAATSTVTPSVVLTEPPIPVTPGAITRVGPDEARRLLEVGAKIVDTRDAAAYQAGHIPGARHLDSGGVRQDVNYWSHKYLVLVYSEREGNSDAIAQWFVSQEFEAVYVLDGGVEAWNGAWETPEGVITKTASGPAQPMATMYEFTDPG